MTDSPNNTNSDTARGPWAKLFSGLLKKKGKGEGAPVPPTQLADNAKAAQPSNKPQVDAEKICDIPLPAKEDPTVSEAREFEDLLLNSQDPLASLRDYVGHASGSYHDRVSPLFRAAGALEGDKIEGLHLNKLRRNGRWWVSLADKDDRDAYDRAMALEVTLNLCDDLTCHAADCDTAAQVAAAFMRVPGFSANDRHALIEPSSSEWESRLQLANYLEDLAAPSRVSGDFQLEIDAHAAVIDVELMRPAALRVASLAGPDQPLVCARSYALRLCLAAAQAAYRCADGLNRVVVNGREAQTGYPLLSLDMALPGLKALLAETDHLAAGELPVTLGVRFQNDPQGWLEPVTPFAQRADELVNPAFRWDAVEINPGVCPPALSQACYARTYFELGINEKAVRVAAWNEMAPNLGLTTRQSVARLVEMRGETRDVSVATACSRAIDALVNGTIDADDKESLAKLFVDGSDLARAVAYAAALEQEKDEADEGFSPQELEDTLARLTDALDPVGATGAYLDDSDNVYRYFNSVGERLRYNRVRADGDRRVSLVPDEYYGANVQAARILCALNRPEEGLAFANEALRVAPMTADAALTKVRCLENASRLYEASELLCATIEQACSARDMALCFYRLAFMQWRLGRKQVAGACYQRAIALYRGLARQAAVELAELLRSGDGVRELETEKDVRRVLSSVNIPFGQPKELRKRALTAAKACAEAQIFSIARPLVGIALEAEHDDALLDVYRSLTPPIPEG